MSLCLYFCVLSRRQSPNPGTRRAAYLRICGNERVGMNRGKIRFWVSGFRGNRKRRDVTELAAEGGAEKYPRQRRNRHVRSGPTTRFSRISPARYNQYIFPCLHAGRRRFAALGTTAPPLRQPTPERTTAPPLPRLLL